MELFRPTAAMSKCDAAQRRSEASMKLCRPPTAVRKCDAGAESSVQAPRPEPSQMRYLGKPFFCQNFNFCQKLRSSKPEI
eukprot:1733901-Pleurochrysis_carterae.AAC.4